MFRFAILQKHCQNTVTISRLREIYVGYDLSNHLVRQEYYRSFIFSELQK